MATQANSERLHFTLSSTAPLADSAMFCTKLVDRDIYLCLTPRTDNTVAYHSVDIYNIIVLSMLFRFMNVSLHKPFSETFNILVDEPNLVGGLPTYNTSNLKLIGTFSQFCKKVQLVYGVNSLNLFASFLKPIYEYLTNVYLLNACNVLDTRHLPSARANIIYFNFQNKPQFTFSPIVRFIRANNKNNKIHHQNTLKQFLE